MMKKKTIIIYPSLFYMDEKEIYEGKKKLASNGKKKKIQGKMGAPKKEIQGERDSELENALHYVCVLPSYKKVR